jgi:hypothetical protein
MHTIQNTIVKISIVFFFAAPIFIVGGCKKEGFTRLLDVELKYKVVPDVPSIKLSDTVKIIAWLPYKQYDRATNSTVDIRGMEVQSWGSMGYMGLDSVLTNDRNIRIYKFETFFDVQHSFGTFKDYPKNDIIGSMAQTDTAFRFELKLVARKPGVFMLRPRGGRGFMDNGRFRIDIAASMINVNYHQHLSQKYMPGVTPYDIDYFFETY